MPEVAVDHGSGAIYLATRGAGDEAAGDEPSLSPKHDVAPTLDRALPGWGVDAISDGVPTSDGREIWGMAVRIAMSAYRRGWSESEYLGEIAGTNSRLWIQLGTRRGGGTLSKSAAYKALRKAWSMGVANANDVGARTLAEIRSDAVELAYLWADRLDRGTDGLSRAETSVMAYVIAETERRGMLRVTCPRRQVAAYAEIGEECAKGALSRLTKRGLLVKYSAGRSGKPGTGKAAIYGLMSPSLES